MADDVLVKLTSLIRKSFKSSDFKVFGSLLRGMKMHGGEFM